MQILNHIFGQNYHDQNSDNSFKREQPIFGVQRQDTRQTNPRLDQGTDFESRGFHGRQNEESFGNFSEYGNLNYSQNESISRDFQQNYDNIRQHRQEMEGGQQMRGTNNQRGASSTLGPMFTIGSQMQSNGGERRW